MTQIDPSQSRGLLRTYRIRVALFLGGVVGSLILLSTAYQGTNTISRLDKVERERDKWQRPAEVLQALDLKDGARVVDLGSGAGYFTLKLSRAVGMGGRVVAVDIRRLPLLFLQIRAFLRNQHNISVVHGTAGDPCLPAGAVDAVLVANTYHEFGNSKAILAHIRRSLVPGGRLVVVDRSPESINPKHNEGEVGHRYLLGATVESELTQTGFEIVNRQDHFIGEPAKESWWLIVARKP